MNQDNSNGPNNVENSKLVEGILFSYFTSRGIGGGVRQNYANCFLLRMANLLIFIHNGGIEKLPYSPNLKMVLIFSCYECLPKGSHEILCHAVVGDKVFW